MAHTEDFTGKRFTHLVCIKRIPNSIKGQIMWEVTCDCGKTIARPISALINKGTKSCGCKKGEMITNSKTKFKDTNEGAFNALYNRYKNRSKFDKKLFSLSKNEFKKIVTSSCFYCDKEPKQISKYRETVFIYNGIDRFNSKLGYTNENSLSCCMRCNWAKNDLSFDEFKSHIKTIIANLEKKNI